MSLRDFHEIKENVHMAKGEKRISISTLDQIMKEYYSNTKNAEWNGVTFMVKVSLSLQEMLEFVNDVVGSCFQDDHGFMPEIMDFAIRSNLVIRYSNFSLPDNLNHRYELLYNTDLVDCISEHINGEQLRDMINSARRKIDYLCAANVADIQNNLSKLTGTFQNLQDGMEKVFSGISPEDVANIAHAIGSGELSEDKIVAAYLKQRESDGDGDA